MVRTAPISPSFPESSSQLWKAHSPISQYLPTRAQTFSRGPLTSIDIGKLAYLGLGLRSGTGFGGRRVPAGVGGSLPPSASTFMFFSHSEKRERRASRSRRRAASSGRI